MSSLAAALNALIFGYRFIQNALSDLPQRDTVNFVGFDVADDPTNEVTTVTNDLTEATGVLPVAGGGTGLSAPGTSGHVLTSNGTIWTSAAPSGGGGTPAGTTNDVQINDAGAFAADTGNFTYDATLHSLTSGAGSACSSNSGAAIGESCTVEADNAVAVCASCTAAGVGSFACGVGGSTTRLGEFAHSSYGPSNFQDRREMGVFANAISTTTDLLQGDSVEFEFDASTVASVEITILAVKTDGSKYAHEKHLLLVIDNGAAIAIVGPDSIITDAAVNMASQGWSATISAPGGHNLRIAVNPGTDTINVGARISWSAFVWP